MGTGGRLPIEVKQYVTFYNTTGVIEREKSIYFCPFLNKDNGQNDEQIRIAWLENFEELAQYDSFYQSVKINQWSPQDRTLKVQGTVGDFRCNYERGLALNYMIVRKDEVFVAGERPVTTYDAYFIESVTQVGNGTISLNVTPDHFTNVFYLHNTDIIIDNKYPADEYGNIDVFSPFVKNSYVKRQHYDRVKPTNEIINRTWYFNNVPEYYWTDSAVELEEYAGWTTITLTINLRQAGSIRHSNISNLTIYPEVIVSIYGESQPAPYHLDDWLLEGETLRLQITWQNRQFDGYIEVEYNGEYDYTEEQISTTEVEEANLPIFSQIEETFKYKRQTRDYKEFINYGEPFTEEEKERINNANRGWILSPELDNDLRLKIVKNSLAFAHVTLNTSNILFRDLPEKMLDMKNLPINKIPNANEVSQGVVTIVKPICNPLDICMKFYYDILNIINNITFIVDGLTLVSYSGSAWKILFDSIFNSDEYLYEKSSLTNYVVSAYISKESSLISAMEISLEGVTINCSLNYSVDADSEKPYLAILPSMNGLTSQQQADYLQAITNRTLFYRIIEEATDKISIVGSSNIDNGFSGCLGIIESTDSINFNLDLSESKKLISKIKSDYYDTVLTFNPYSFYTVSYLGRIEVPLQKLNYYENYIIPVELTINPTNIFRYSFIPTYTVNGKKMKYYSESLEQTVSNELTVVNAQLTSYLIANKSQMKNQFAVNNVDHATGLVSNVISGAVNIATAGLVPSLFGMANLAGVARGSAGAKAGAGLISNVISWIGDNAKIDMTQKAQLGDLGSMPSNVKQVGTDIITDMNNNEIGLYLNHYTIDKVSHDSICKYLERFGYLVNIYDKLSINSRVGWNYIELASFDYEAHLSTEQEESIRQILENGVTLLHNPSYLNEGHNYETFIDYIE